VPVLRLQGTEPTGNVFGRVREVHRSRKKSKPRFGRTICGSEATNSGFEAKDATRQFRRSARCLERRVTLIVIAPKGLFWAVGLTNR